jgi:predicted TIM-barrel fold metal-dependent hydrolase
MNDWTISEWLERDPRLRGSIIVATQEPDVAATEIARCAPNRRMRQVVLGGNGIGRAFGHAVFHPIYAAAAEAGLPVAIHSGSSGGMNPPAVAGGGIARFMELHALAAQAATTHLVSLIANGVFERFRDLRVVLLGAGVAWLPALLWRMDTDFKGVRREVPWVRQLPSRYVREHLFFDTHPLEALEPTAGLTAILRSLHSPQGLLFGSGYPCWDMNDVGALELMMPAEWQPRIQHENAAELYGWSEVQAGQALLA